MSLSFDHPIPGRKGKLAVCARFVNAMKTDLSGEEFAAIVNYAPPKGGGVRSTNWEAIHRECDRRSHESRISPPFPPRAQALGVPAKFVKELAAHLGTEKPFDKGAVKFEYW